MFPSSLLTLIFFSVKILQELSELNVSISPPSTCSSFYHSVLSASPIPSKLFPTIAMTISPSNPMTTSVFIWLVFSLAFDIINSPSFPWLSLMPSFLHFSFPREVLPHSRCLINDWTKNLPPFPPLFLFPILFSFLFYSPLYLGSDSFSLMGKGEGFLILTLPCMTEKQWSEYQSEVYPRE